MLRTLNLVGVTGFEPAASWSQTKRATICATSRYHSIISQSGIFVKRYIKKRAADGNKSQFNGSKSWVAARFVFLKRLSSVTSFIILISCKTAIFTVPSICPRISQALL